MYNIKSFAFLMYPFKILLLQRLLGLQLKGQQQQVCMQGPTCNALKFVCNSRLKFKTTYQSKTGL